MAINLGSIASGFKGLSPEAQAAIIRGGFGAVGDVLTGVGQGKIIDQQRDQSAAGLLASFRLAPGEEPNAYTNLAIRRELFGGMPQNATMNNVGGTMGVPAEMQSFMPQVSGGINLEGARQAAMSRLSEENLNADLERRRGIENQALQMALSQQQGQQKKKGGGFLGFLKKALPIASMAIPFVGPAIGMGAMATTAAATGLGALGGGLRGGAGGALMGGLSGYVGSKIPSGSKTPGVSSTPSIKPVPKPRYTLE